MKLPEGYSLKAISDEVYSVVQNRSGYGVCFLTKALAEKENAVLEFSSEYDGLPSVSGLYRYRGILFDQRDPYMDTKIEINPNSTMCCEQGDGFPLNPLILKCDKVNIGAVVCSELYNTKDSIEMDELKIDETQNSTIRFNQNSLYLVKINGINQINVELGEGIEDSDNAEINLERVISKNSTVDVFLDGKGENKHGSSMYTINSVIFADSEDISGKYRFNAPNGVLLANLTNVNNVEDDFVCGFDSADEISVHGGTHYLELSFKGKEYREGDEVIKKAMICAENINIKPSGKNNVINIKGVSTINGDFSCYPKGSTPSQASVTSIGGVDCNGKLSLHSNISIEDVRIDLKQEGCFSLVNSKVMFCEFKQTQGRDVTVRNLLAKSSKFIDNEFKDCSLRVVNSTADYDILIQNCDFTEAKDVSILYNIHTDNEKYATQSLINCKFKGEEAQTASFKSSLPTIVKDTLFENARFFLGNACIENCEISGEGWIRNSNVENSVIKSSELADVAQTSSSLIENSKLYNISSVDSSVIVDKEISDVVEVKNDEQPKSGTTSAFNIDVKVDKKTEQIDL